ncbi:hypothetical protein CTAYLR_004771 [Chrysophaeum taylorii]|uniref:Uncharacterized protein n=1 Tax=Chrysophaeum taylorii TaxID=2483200 RepID=A0AAD7XQ32_9STRA|nr:hypothetical protein CTAYLR_006439 [Chrysophaeum taylorii]KAJ8613135.1 hypothetical protein CTAYLR_004771 [Chrysophaeum taylorii]
MCVVAFAANASNHVKKRKDPILAKCHRVKTSRFANSLRKQNRSLLVVVQTITPSKSNVCEGLRADWREGLGQCLAKLTGLPVVAQNDDGTCANCHTLKKTSCDIGPPPGLIVVLGGGEDPNKSMRFRCSGTYCRRTGKSFDIGLGHFPPHDYRAACDVHAFDKRHKPIFSGRIDATFEPSTRIAWFPILNPQAEIRSLWERSTLYSTNLESDGALPELPPLPKRQPRLYPKPSDPSDSDYSYQKKAIEPAFEEAGRVRIDVIRDDAFAKPLLLPPLERTLYQDTAKDADWKPREPMLIYSGQYRPNKGQLDFLRKLDPDALGMTLGSLC